VNIGAFGGVSGLGEQADAQSHHRRHGTRS
jgi:hypothetical protein